MKKILIIVFLMNIFGQFIGQKLVFKEFLGKPTQNSVNIKMFFDSDVEMSVQYGQKSNVYTSQTAWFSGSNLNPLEITIDKLASNTKYFYRTQFRAKGSQAITTRPEFSFQTQRDPSTDFTFIVQSDPHLDEQSDTALFRLCLQNQLEDQPDFMIDLGDILMTDKLKNASGVIPRDTIIYRSKLFRNYYETISHSVPIFISMGNHEGESGWNLNNTANNIAIWGTLERKKYFMNPSPNSFYSGDITNHSYVGLRENYYEFTWGNAQFIILDPYWYTTSKPGANSGWLWTLGKDQYLWLKSVLEKSKSTFKFIFAHQLIGGDPNGRGGIEFANFYEWGGKNLDGTDGFQANRPSWYKPIKDLLMENKVTIFFHGHDHFYGKQDLDCLVYQETPQPSHPIFASANQAKEYGYLAGDILPNAGHLRVNVSQKGVKVDYVRAYLPKNETSTRKNKDVSASYFINPNGCYDKKSNNIVLWSTNYSEEIVYPNPFEQFVTFSFNLSKEDQVNLFIINESGQIVKQLLRNASTNNGQFQAYWDGKNEAGLRMPSGAYYYQLISQNSTTKTGKLILSNP